MKQTPAEFLAFASEQIPGFTRRLDDLQARFEFLPALELWRSIDALAQRVSNFLHELPDDGGKYAAHAARLIVFATEVSRARMNLEKLILEHEVGGSPADFDAVNLPGSDPAIFLRAAPGRVWGLIQRLDAARQAPQEHDLPRFRNDVETFSRTVATLELTEALDIQTRAGLCKLLIGLVTDARELP